jgi:hypothetical protein
MGFWNGFWIANFIVAGASFAIITLVVMVRGTGELWTMLKSMHGSGDSGKEAGS